MIISFFRLAGLGLLLKNIISIKLTDLVDKTNELAVTKSMYLHLFVLMEREMVIFQKKQQQQKLNGREVKIYPQVNWILYALAVKNIYYNSVNR